jgi:hypothetical protein
MSEFSNFLEDAIINATLRGDNSDLPNGIVPHLSLLSTDPTDADAGTETTWVGYNRMVLTFDAPVDGYTQNTSAVTFPPSDGTYNVTHIGVYDSLTGGNLLYHTPLNNTKTLYSTDTITFNAGSVQITVA